MLIATKIITKIGDHALQFPDKLNFRGTFNNSLFEFQVAVYFCYLSKITAMWKLPEARGSTITYGWTSPAYCNEVGDYMKNN